MLVTSAWTERHPHGARVCPACPPPSASPWGAPGRTSVPGANHARTKAQSPACSCSVKAALLAVPSPGLNPHTGGAESSHPSHWWSVTWLCTGRAPRVPFVRVPGPGELQLQPGQPEAAGAATQVSRATPALGPPALGSSTAPHQHWLLPPGTQSPAGTARGEDSLPCPGRGPACHQRGDPATGSSAQRAPEPSAGWGPPR